MYKVKQAEKRNGMSPDLAWVFTEFKPINSLSFPLETENLRFSDIFLRRNKLMGLNQFMLFFKEPVNFDLSLAVLRIFMIFRVYCS